MATPRAPRYAKASVEIVEIHATPTTMAAANEIMLRRDMTNPFLRLISLYFGQRPSDQLDLDQLPPSRFIASDLNRRTGEAADIEGSELVAAGRWRL